jgi:hypothetical protein
MYICRKKQKTVNRVFVIILIVTYIIEAFVCQIDLLAAVERVEYD